MAGGGVNLWSGQAPGQCDLQPERILAGQTVAPGFIWPQWPDTCILPIQYIPSWLHVIPTLSEWGGDGVMDGVRRVGKGMYPVLL